MKLKPNEHWTDHDPDQLEFWRAEEKREKVWNYLCGGLICAIGAAVVVAIGYLFS